MPTAAKPCSANSGRYEARLVEIPDSRTFVPLDQPQRLADEVAAFAPASVTA